MALSYIGVYSFSVVLTYICGSTVVVIVLAPLAGVVVVDVVVLTYICGCSCSCGYGDLGFGCCRCSGSNLHLWLLL